MASTPLILVGGAVQASGFFLALHEAGHTRRTEVPDHPALHRRAATLVLRRVETILIWARLRPPRTVTAQLAGSIGMTANLTGRVPFNRSGPTTEERFDALEKEVQEHRAQAVEEHQRLEAKIGQVSTSVTEVRESLESDRKARLRRSLWHQEAGVWIFVFGLLLSAIGSVV